MVDSALKIGIIRLSSLGDIISTMVFLEFIRTKFASSGRKIEITFIVDTQFRGILADSAMIDSIIDLPLRASKKNKKLLFEIYRKTRQLGCFDILIDAQGLLKSALIGALIKKKKFVGFSADSAREKMASLFYHKKANIAYGEHILKRQYELFKVAFEGDSAPSQNLEGNISSLRNFAKQSCGNPQIKKIQYLQSGLPREQSSLAMTENNNFAESSLDSAPKWENEFCLDFLENRNLNLGFSAQAREKIAQILAPFKANKKILFLCETSKADKEFSLDSFYALAKGLWSDYEDARIFLIWDKKESEIRALGAKDARFCVLPHLDFDEIKALLASMDLVIGGDTGITHSAWAMKVPSVTIYVSTDMKRFALEGEKHFSLCVGNSSLGMQFRTCEKFWESTDSGLVLSQNFSQIQKPYRNHFDCDSRCESATNQTRFAESNLDSANSQNLGEKSTQIVETNPFCHSKSSSCHSERSEESQNNPSLRANPQDLRSNPPVEKTQNLQNGLPRSHSLARNDENLDSSLRKCSAQNDKNSVQVAESSLDSAPSKQGANSAIADEFLGFCEASDEDRTLVHQGSEPKRALRKQLAHTCKSLKSRCESEFASILRFAKKVLL